MSNPTPARAELVAQGEGWRVTGVLTFATVPDLDKAGAGLPWSAGCLAIDLAGVTHADSAGLALLVEWTRRARAAGGDIRFEGVPGQLRAAAAVSGLAELLPLG